MSSRHLCPHCGADILEISRNCPVCGRKLLTEEDIGLIHDWIYKPRPKPTRTSEGEPLFGGTESPKVARWKFWYYLRFDPIVRELLLAGLKTYSQHFQIYLLLILSYLIVFSTFAGVFTLLGQTRLLVLTLGNPLEILVGATLNFFIAWAVTTSAHYLSYRQTLSTGALGLAFKLPNSPVDVLKTIGFSMFILLYFVLFGALFRVGSLLSPHSWSTATEFIARLTAFVFSTTIVLLFLAFFFFLAVRFSYDLYHLEQSTVPMMAIDGVLFVLGLCYALLLLSLNIVPVLTGNQMAEELVAVVSFILPGTLIMPIYAYAMAHLKVASSLLEFEGLPLPEGASLE